MPVMLKTIFYCVKDVTVYTKDIKFKIKYVPLVS